MESWRRVYSCKVYNSQTLTHWIKLVCILSRSTCINHRTRGWFESDRKYRSHRLFHDASRCGMDKYLHKLEGKVVYIYPLHKGVIRPIKQFLIQGNLSHHPLLFVVLEWVAIILFRCYSIFTLSIYGFGINTSLSCAFISHPAGLKMLNYTVNTQYWRSSWLYPNLVA